MICSTFQEFPYTNGSERGNAPSATPREKLFLSHKKSYSTLKVMKYFLRKPFSELLFWWGKHTTRHAELSLSRDRTHPLKWKLGVLTTGLPGKSWTFFWIPIFVTIPVILSLSFPARTINNCLWLLCSCSAVWVLLCFMAHYFPVTGTVLVPQIFAESISEWNWPKISKVRTTAAAVIITES